MRVSITEGLDFVLTHFGGDNALYPKFVAVGEDWMIPVNSKSEALTEFYRGQLINCRICPYPKFVEDYRKSDARGAMVSGGVGIGPNFLFIDIDRGAFSKTLDAYSAETENTLNTVLYKVLDNINQRFHGVFKPTVLWTGNGYHIYLPVQLSGPSWCLGHTDLFLNVSKKPDVEFLRWAEYYLSDGLADPAHYTTCSFNNMWCRVPGSFNLKVGVAKPVVLVQKWDGHRPYINWILRDFHSYLIDKSLKPKTEGPVEFKEFSSKWN